MKKRISKDKWLHFGVCAIVAILCPMFSLGLGIGKEFGDSRASGNKWDWWDILADVLGVAVGGAIHFLILKLILN